MTSAPQYRSWCFTIRPKNGITDRTIECVKTWLDRQDYGMMCEEMTGEARHVHGQIWMNESRPKGVIQTAMCRIAEKSFDEWDAASKKVLRGGVRIGYSDWVLNYCVDNEGKSDPPKIIYDKQPEYTAHFYPTEEEQNKVQAKAKAVDHKYHHLEELWYEYCEDWHINFDNVSEFLYDMMFVDRKILCISDLRKRIDVAKTLHEYLVKDSKRAKAFFSVPRKVRR